LVIEKNAITCLYLEDSLKIVIVFQVWLKSNNMNGQFTWRLLKFLIKYLSGRTLLSPEFVKINETHIVRSEHSFVAAFWRSDIL